MAHRYHILRVRTARGLAKSTVCISLLPSYHSKRHTKSHTLCRRCGNRAFHKQHKGACLTITVLLRKTHLIHPATTSFSLGSHQLSAFALTTCISFFSLRAVRLP